MNETGLTRTDDGDRRLDVPDAVRRALARTPARLLVGRAGPGYRTETWLGLRADHAAARDAVRAELDLMAAFGEDRIAGYSLFWAGTRARTRDEYLLRPDLGRRLDDESRELVRVRCPAGADLQVVIGDGLSAAAAAAQAPALLDRLRDGAKARGWRFGRPFVVRQCRVGVLNDVGDLLDPAVVVLLVGERPGLVTAESLSAYLAYRPRPGHTDADRNLISNIHARGVSTEEAAARVLALAARMMSLGTSGVSVKEEKTDDGR
jgi:ethanolamine ammonia-lyase small subunit